MGCAKKINIQNKRARFEYELLDQYTAGIVLTGTEIKSIRLSKASIAESFCEFNDRGELFVVNMHIEEYAWGFHYNHRPKAERASPQQTRIAEAGKEVKNVGLTIVPLRSSSAIKAMPNWLLLWPREKTLRQTRNHQRSR